MRTVANRQIYKLYKIIILKDYDQFLVGREKKEEWLLIATRLAKDKLKTAKHLRLRRML